MQVFSKEGDIEVDLNCCFLREREDRSFFCDLDKDGEELRGCTGCHGYTYLNRKKVRIY